MAINRSLVSGDSGRWIQEPGTRAIMLKLRTWIPREIDYVCVCGCVCVYSRQRERAGEKHGPYCPLNAKS